MNNLYSLPAAGLLCLAVSSSGLAQSFAAVTPAGAPQTHASLNTARYNRADTLRAVRHLFMQRCAATRGWLQTGAGMVASAAAEKSALAMSGIKNIDPQYYQTLQQDANSDLLVGGLVAGYGLFRLSRFGPGRYQRVVEAYAQGAPLPAYLSRHLKTKYFRLLPPL